MNAQSVDHANAAAVAVTKSQRGLHTFACVLVLLTIGLIAAGAMVTSTGSGLSVPDWPTTYGENMFLYHPSKWIGGIFYEHGHRLLASSIGFLTIILAVYAQWRGRTKMIRVLGWIALATVIAQGVLGGMTVRFLLPTWISVFHACLAQTFLCILVTIAVLTHHRFSENTSSATGETPRSGRIWFAPLALVLVVFAQLVAGALMRHTQSGLAIPDFPLAYGQWIPDLSDEAILRYNDSRAFDYQLAHVAKPQILAHLVHRAGALLVVLAVVAMAIVIRRTNRSDSVANRAIMWIAMLVVIQVTLGAYTVWSGKLPVVTTAHVAVGAATLAAVWRCFLLTRLCPSARTSAARCDHDVSLAPITRAVA